ncbi:DUF1343 domain-containing protein [Fulvivirgaceae bacterium PWU4]|uniref:DUF1343 domain-containing protein n=1 Tax=Chryseosolibacter histidini TaxID=2782349 RepID=A0AAP2DPV0_9BACT|nr:DUF1343 domain-containing protein [Chryseosolibacter histidini]MBT1699163.1 DUF1343 domain-containing protein [Chryseosolibacter histidini]
MRNINLFTWLLLASVWFQCGNTQPVLTEPPARTTVKTSPLVGAAQLDVFLPKLKGKNVGLVVNHTALVGKTHLADTLKAQGITIKKVFAPEHGFRGAVPDGETIKDGFDTKSGLPVISLYGNNKKPTPEQLADVDVLIFDIQDVGVRFYTFISTLHYVMEAAAEQGKKVLVLDRPNPNGSYTDGPVLDPALKSFVGIHPIPVVHGVTVGELARMINGEGWLDKGVKCDLEVVPVKNWSHQDPYSLSPKPSPNLPNDQAIRLYPSLCLFEGTVISVGRGTQTPFLIVGNPLLKDLPFQFTPVAIPAMSNTPLHQNKLYYGLDLRQVKVEPRLDLKYLIDLYQRYPEKEKFFTSYFDKLAGTTALRQQITGGMTEEAIRKTWQKDLDTYRTIRQKYLMYP